MPKWSVFLFGASALNYLIPAYSFKFLARVGQPYQAPLTILTISTFVHLCASGSSGLFG